MFAVYNKEVVPSYLLKDEHYTQVESVPLAYPVAQVVTAVTVTVVEEQVSAFPLQGIHSLFINTYPVLHDFTTVKEEHSLILVKVPSEHP